MLNGFCPLSNPPPSVLLSTDGIKLDGIPPKSNEKMPTFSYIAYIYRCSSFEDSSDKNYKINLLFLLLPFTIFHKFSLKPPLP